MVEPAGRSAAAKKSTTSMSSSALRKKKPEKERLAAEKQQQNSGSKKQSSSGTAAGAEPAAASVAAAAESPSYRLALRSLFSCRNTHAQHHAHRVPPPADSGAAAAAMASKKCKKQQQQQLGCSSGASICKLRDAGPRRPVLLKPEEEPMTAKRRASVSGAGGGGSGGERRVVKKALQQRQGGEAVAVVVSSSSSSSSAAGGSFRLRRLSGCYECHHMVVDPMSGGGGGSMRAAVFSCPDCGDVFVRAESLHRHQSTRHAVSELGPEDTSRNIIEIIFQSSWLKKQSPVCAVDRILKVHNAPATLARFEAHRDAVKAKALAVSSGSGGGGGARCTADGNELLRFHCVALACSLGLRGATHLCDHASCAACAIVRDGFVVVPGAGVRTMATSGRAHDAVVVAEAEGGERRRAMLVCRVIAGRVKRPAQEKEAPAPELEKAAAGDDLPEMETKTAEEEEEEYDSVAGSAGVYSSMDELEVFNPTAILPCFVVVYKA